MATRNQAIYSAEYLYNELKIPRRYLRRLLTELSKLGFIKSSSGRSGGFVFAKDLSEINFLTIINAMEGPEAFSTCLLGFSCCIVDKPCVMHNAWTEARSKMIETLMKTTFADLKNKYIEDIPMNIQIN
jgi:Rrf2 family protein